MIRNLLKKLNLKEKEIEAYLTLLEFGMQPASIVAKKIFVRKTFKNNITQYLAEKTGNIKLIFEKQKEKYMDNYNKHINDLDALSPLLMKYENNNFLFPKIEIYEGVKGVAKSFVNFYEGIPEREIVYDFVSPAPLESEMLRRELGDTITARISKKIFSYTLVNPCEDAVRLKILDDKQYRITKMSFEKVLDSITSEILIYKNKFLCMSGSKDGIISTIIINKDIALMHRAIFEMAWQQAIKDDEKICKRKSIQDLFKKLKGIRNY